MKLVYCPACDDIVALKRMERHCLCGLSWGRYIYDEDADASGMMTRAVFGGLARPVGMDSRDLQRALVQAGEHDGWFVSWVYKDDAENIRRETSKEVADYMLDQTWRFGLDWDRDYRDGKDRKARERKRRKGDA